MTKSLSYVTFLVISTASVILLPNLVNHIYAQNTTGFQASTASIGTAQPSSTTLGVKITSPTNNQQVPIQNNDSNSNSNGGLQLTGTSTDTVDLDCYVSVIANDVKPYQNTTATGPGGNEDYSVWAYSLAPPLLKEGSNKVTARISCIDINTSASSLPTESTNQVKHYSIFFTALNASAPAVTNNSSTITTPAATTAAANTSDGAKALTTTTTTTATSGPSIRTGAVPRFVSNPTCQVDQLSHDLNCNIKIAGIENIAKIRPFLHADLTTSCINHAGNTPSSSDKIRTVSLIGDSKSIRAVVDVNCPPPMTPSFIYKNVELQVGDVLLPIPGTFTLP